MKDKLAFAIMRIGLGIVFLLFGIGKFQNDMWAQTMRNMPFIESLPWRPDLSVVLVGVVELLTAGALILGLYTRVFGAVAAVQLLAILVLLRFQETRDIALVGAAIYVALSGSDSFGLGGWRYRKKKDPPG